MRFEMTHASPAQGPPPQVIFLIRNFAALPELLLSGDAAA